jgi:hypothetical protein
LDVRPGRHVYWKRRPFIRQRSHLDRGRTAWANEDGLPDRIKEAYVNVSDQVDALQQRVAELKSSFNAARRESNEQVKARIDNLKADIAARQDAARDKAVQDADRAQSQWASLKADAAAKRADLQARIERRRDQQDVKRAEQDAEDAEADAADALDYASWAVDQAQLAVLDAIDARSWADARAAASPSS